MGFRNTQYFGPLQPFGSLRPLQHYCSSESLNRSIEFDELVNIGKCGRADAHKPKSSVLRKWSPQSRVKKIQAIIVYVARTLDRKKRWIFVVPDFRGKFAKALR